MIPIIDPETGECLVKLSKPKYFAPDGSDVVLGESEGETLANFVFELCRLGLISGGDCFQVSTEPSGKVLAIGFHSHYSYGRGRKPRPVAPPALPARNGGGLSTPESEAWVDGGAEPPKGAESSRLDISLHK